MHAGGRRGEHGSAEGHSLVTGGGTAIYSALDGMGLLGFEAALGRDYPVMFGTLWTLGLLGLLVGLVGDLMYTLVDPRIDFETRGS